MGLTQRLSKLAMGSQALSMIPSGNIKVASVLCADGPQAGPGACQWITITALGRSVVCCAAHVTVFSGTQEISLSSLRDALPTSTNLPSSE